MSDTELPEYLRSYQKKEENLVLSHLDESEKELYRQYCPLCKVTAADLQREYSAEDVKQLCLRTKVRVKMTLLNCVWDAKRRLEKKGRLAGRSERFVHAMLVKAVTKKMVIPYTEEDVANYNLVAKSELKKLNNIRLDRYKRESKDQSTSSLSPLSALSLRVENSEDSSTFLEPDLPPSQSFTVMANMDADDEDGSSTNLQNSTVDSNSEMWGIGSEEESAKQPESQPNELPSFDKIDGLGWVQLGMQVNSESLTVGDYLGSQSQPQSQSQPGYTADSEDYTEFGTQVAAASTQENQL